MRFMSVRSRVADTPDEERNSMINKVDDKKKRILFILFLPCICFMEVRLTLELRLTALFLYIFSLKTSFPFNDLNIVYSLSDLCASGKPTATGRYRPPSALCQNFRRSIKAFRDSSWSVPLFPPYSLWYKPDTPDRWFAKPQERGGIGT